MSINFKSPYTEEKRENRSIFIFSPSTGSDQICALNSNFSIASKAELDSRICLDNYFILLIPRFSSDDIRLFIFNIKDKYKQI